jgi:hypothetical protein
MDTEWNVPLAECSCCVCPKAAQYRSPKGDYCQGHYIAALGYIYGEARDPYAHRRVA